MRTKEEADDYRYFPEPDLPPLDARRRRGSKQVRRALPELPDARRRRFVAQYHLPEYDAGVLTQSMALADYFERVAAGAGNPKAASNWVMGDADGQAERDARRRSTTSPLPPDALAELIVLIDKGAISGPIAKDVFEKMYGSGRRAAEIVEAEGLGAGSTTRTPSIASSPRSSTGMPVRWPTTAPARPRRSASSSARS